MHLDLCSDASYTAGKKEKKRKDKKDKKKKKKEKKWLVGSGSGIILRMYHRKVRCVKKFFLILHPDPCPAPPNQSCELAQLCWAQSKEKEEEVLILFWCLVCINSGDFDIVGEKPSITFIGCQLACIATSLVWQPQWEMQKMSQCPTSTMSHPYLEIWLDSSDSAKDSSSDSSDSSDSSSSSSSWRAGGTPWRRAG